jgi:PAS domain S-box-containing protein
VAKLERELKADFENLFEIIKDLIFIIDHEGIILYINSSLLKKLNFSEKELLRESILKIYSSEYHEKVRKFISDQIKDAKIFFDIPLKTKNGTLVPVTTRIIKGEFGNKNALIGINKEIISVSSTEEALSKAEREKSLILRAVLDHIIYYDTDFNIIWANRAASDSLDLPNEAIVGKKCYILWQNNDVPCEGCPVLQALHTGKSASNQMETPDGRYWLIRGFPVKNKENKIIGAVEITRDITDFKLAEFKLKESEERFRALFKGILDPLYIWEKKDNDFILVNYNNAAENQTLGDVKNYVGMTASEMYSSLQNRKDIIDDLNTCYENKTNIVREMNYYIDILKSENDLKVKYSYIPPDYVMVQTEDISTSKKAEKKLKQSEIKYRLAYNRANFYKDLFAHDMNNILQNILSSIELSSIYLENPDKFDTLRDVLKISKEQVKRGSVLISNVRKLSKLEENEIFIYPTDALKILKASIKNVVKDFRNKEIEVEINNTFQNVQIQANELLSDVFENILTNSIKHNNNSMVIIDINISKTQEEGKEYFKFEILDNGIGIPDPKKDIIFLRAFVPEKTLSGLGIGLSLVNKIITSFKGRIWVEDKVKGDYRQGSKFIILLPQAR